MTNRQKRHRILDRIHSLLHEADSESQDDERLQLVLSAIHQLLNEICESISYIEWLEDKETSND